MKITDPAERFWAAVDKSGECWLWTYSKHSYGHGQYFFRGHNVHAHRVAWILANGEIAPGMCVCHACDVPACVRPSHLFLGTQRDNLADMRQKQRGYLGYAVTPPNGRLNVNAVLCDSDVVEIRRAYASGEASLRQLGRRFGIAHTAIASVVKRRTWAHVQ